MKNVLVTIKHVFERNYVIIIITIIVLWVIQFSNIPSGSMSPTIATGSIIVNMNLIKYIPKRGDIISFSLDWDSNYLVKRVIGIPGDVIEFKDDQVYINGEVLEEDYLPDDTATLSQMCSSDTYVVPEGKLFVMGDNRLTSYDSRLWDDPYVSVDDVFSIYLFTIYNSHNYSDYKSLDTFKTFYPGFDDYELIKKVLEAENIE